MATIHIKTSTNIDDRIISELMNVLIKYKFETKKYLGNNSKIVMARKEE